MLDLPGPTLGLGWDNFLYVISGWESILDAVGRLTCNKLIDCLFHLLHKIPCLSCSFLPQAHLIPLSHANLLTLIQQSAIHDFPYVF